MTIRSLLLLGSTLALLIALTLSPPAASAERASPPAPGATVQFSHLTTQDGLSQSAVRIVLQDRHGFMWIGTEGGLNRYDGYTFTVYQNDPQDPHSLSDDQVLDLHEDDNGRLWIATHGGGVNRFDPQAETFTSFRHDPDDPNSLVGDTIFSIFQDSRGCLWFGGPPILGGLTRFDPASGTFTRYWGGPGTDLGELAVGGVWDIVEDGDGDLWLAADSVLARLNVETKILTTYAPDTGDRRITALHRDGDGTLWVGGNAGLYQFDAGSGTFTHYQPGHPIAVHDILSNDDGTLWIGTGGEGLYLFDAGTGQFAAHYAHNPSVPTSLVHDVTQNLYRDRGGILWISTREGLSLYDPRQTQFAYYRHDPQDPHSQADDAVWGMDGDDASGDLWIGVGGNLGRFDLDTARTTNYALDTASPALVDPTTGVVYTDPEGAIWAGVGSSLYRFDRASGDVTAYDLQTLHGADAPLLMINSLYRQSEILWIGSLGGGLIRFDLQAEEFEMAFEPPHDLVGQGDPRFLLSHGVSKIYGDRNGTIWIGYSSGELSRLAPGTGILRHYRRSAENPHTISSGFIMDIYQDQSGVLWLASRHGLTRFDLQTKAFTLYTEGNGLPSSHVTGIQEDQDGHLWLSTMAGLSRFDPQEETFDNYNAVDGVGSTEFPGPSWQSADGRIFFGGREGLTAFHPDQITPDPYEPPIVLTELYLSHEPVDVEEGSLLKQPIWTTDHLTLEPDHTSVSFEFAALSYIAPQENCYRYILEGIDEAWTEAGSDQRIATYTYLPPGDYVFRVQGTNDDGVWSSHETKLSITVLPHWWETWWFRLALALTIVALFLGGVRWRVSALQRRSRALEAEVAARTERLRQSEDRFATVMNSMESLMYVADMETYELLFVNQTVRDTFGEVEGQICWQVLQADQAGPCDFCTNQDLLKDGCPTGVCAWEFHNPVTGRWYYMQDRAIRWTDGRWVRLEVATDITERKHLENQSQRLAVMEERERIGRELHDDLGQVMGYVSVQAQAALERLGREEPEQVRAILHQLVQAASEAHDDVRQYILGVRTRAASAPRNLFTALEEYLGVLRERYGLSVQVSWPEDLLESPLAPEVETQLLRIIQEALTNVRKHAGVDTARLLFTVHPEGVQVIIEDDGCGFELGAAGRRSRRGRLRRNRGASKSGDVRIDVPDAAGGSLNSIGFGLQIMRERAESVGGSLEVRSAPGKGTRVIVRLPCSLDRPDPGRFGNGLRVLLVDDHPLYLEGLRGLLTSRGVQVVGEAHDGLEALAQAQALRPDLILMDVQMPRCDGVEATRRIKAELPEIEIVMLTMAADEETLFEALKAGASGYLLKNLAGTQFFALLRQVMAGERVISPALASRVLAEFAQQNEDAEAEDEPVLTARQREVLELVAQGLTNQEVADALHVTEATIKYHVSQILERLELKSRHQLARYVDEV